MRGAHSAKSVVAYNMAGSVSVDLSALKQLERQLKSTASGVQAGWFSSAKYNDGTPVASIAALMEHGTQSQGIPARPFLRQAIAKNEGDWASLADQAALQFVQGNISSEQMLNLLGAKASGDIQESIIDGDFAPLSPITIALRRLKNDGVKITGSTVGAVAAAIKQGKTGPGELGDQSFGNKDPLRDTGKLIATITHEVI